MTMTIELRLYASLNRYMPEGSLSHTPCLIDIEEGTTIRSLLEGLQVPMASVKTVFLNGIHTTGDTVPKDGDRVGVFPPVAGG